MTALVLFEFSARVRDALNAVGIDAWSCDLWNTEGRQGNHLHGDYRWALEGRLDRFDAIDIRTGLKPLYKKWDLVIAHPPCTYLTNAGSKHLYIGGRKENGPDPKRWKLMRNAVTVLKDVWSADVPKLALENPIMHNHAREAFGVPYSQIIQPWMFGHQEMKATCLWLRGLPLLQSTDNVGPPPTDPGERKQWARVHRESPGPDRWKNRSRTLTGIADAMAT